MAETRTIARPYAEAVFRLAKAKDELGAWSDMLQVTSAIAADERIRTLIGNPKVPPRRLGELLLSSSAYAWTDSMMKDAISFYCWPKIAVSKSCLK
jgi:F0F1-type ATP synthase delta subunit